MKLSRRSFMLAAASVATLPWARHALVPYARATETSLLFMADMNVRDFAEYAVTGAASGGTIFASGNTPVISANLARTGSKSARMYLHRKNSSNSYRTEATCQQKTLQFLKTHWIGFSIYVPANWAISNTWEVLFQLHNHPLEWTALGFSPIAAIRLDSNDDRWKLTQSYVQTEEGTHLKSDRRSAFTHYAGKIARGQWADWVLEYRPDWRDISKGGVGVTRWWKDGVLVKSYEGPNCVNETNPPYIKFGAYKSAWKDRNHNDPVVERIYYYDEFRVSRPGEGTYALVAPDRSILAAAPSPPDPVKVE